MIGEVAVRNRDESRSFNSTDQIGGAMRKKQMIQPDIRGSEDADGAPIRPQAIAIMRGRVSHHGRPGGHKVKDANAVNDNVGYVLNGDPRSPSNVHIEAAPIDGFVAVHNQFLSKLDSRVFGENDPQGLRLDDSPPQCPVFGVHHIVVTAVCDHIQRASFATHGVLPEPYCAVGKRLAIRFP